MNTINVLNNNGEIEPFDSRRIRTKLHEETGLDKEEINRITQSVLNIIKKNYEKEISTSAIRSLINNQLIKRGYVLEEEKTRKLGMSRSDIDHLIEEGCKDNANIGYSPEMVSKYIYDANMKEYSLLIMPPECAEAHKEGLIHIHDLEYYPLRPNCMNYDLRFFARNGLKIDGRGDMGSVAKPAKSLEVLLNHMLQAWMAGATVFSGGQGYINFNTFLSPFCEGRTYEEIKQAIQMFIFNCNMSLICRGGQVLFSSIALDMSCPPILADEPAISFGGVAIGTYKDYQEEADLIFRAVCEVSNEKDGENAWHRFPNIMFNIREGDLDKYEGTCKLLHETGANNPTIYYNNCTGIEKSIMGCRTALPMNYTGEYGKDCANTGNFMYDTINLPLLALEVDGDIDKFYKYLDNICEICYKSLIHRRETVYDAIYNKHIADFLLQKDKENGLPLWDIQYTTMTLGYCGLNEALIVLTGKGIEDEEAEELGVQIIEFINNKKDQFKNRDGLRWSVIASPAESTAHRFATIIKNKYPEATVQGVEGSYYLTNSHHIPVSLNVHWMNHVRNAKKFHHLSMGGALLHIWSGEVWSDPEAIWKLNRRILEYGDPVFWAYSKVFTFCRECQFTINDRLEECPICGSKNLRVYDRITGYYLGVDTFNNGKVAEFENRYRHRISDKT